MPEQRDRRRHLRTAGVALLGILVGLALGILLAPDEQPVPPPVSPSIQPEASDAVMETPGPPTATPAQSARTEQAAVEAAVEWMRLFTPELYLDDDARRRTVSEVAAADAEQELQGITADIAENFREAGLTSEVAASSLRVAAPAGYQIRTFDEEEAEVAVWVAQVVHLGEVSPLAASWDTQVTSMRWEDGQWRLVSVQNVDGPIPDITAQGDGQLPQTLDAIESLTEFDHVP